METRGNPPPLLGGLANFFTSFLIFVSRVYPSLINKLWLVGMQLPGKYKANFDASSEGAFYWHYLQLHWPSGTDSSKLYPSLS